MTTTDATPVPAASPTSPPTPAAPRGRGTLKTAGALLAVLLACLPPLVIRSAPADVTRIMENISLLSSQETWLRLRGTPGFPREPDAWLMPSWNGRPRVTKPPMLVWVHLLAWAGLDPARDGPDALTRRARLASALMAELTLAGVFWCAMTLWTDRRTAAIAALAAGTSWFLQRQGRSATYDIHMTAWATLAVAAALAAMRHAAVGRSGRAWLGWCLAGAALAAAWLTKGPLALMVVAIPVGAAVALSSPPRRRALLAAAGMAVVACALALPWYAYAESHVSTAAGTWLTEYRAQRDAFQPPYYYIVALGMAAPWTLWLVGGLAQPFLPESATERRRLLVAWVWFVGVFVAFSIPGAKQQRYILPIMPAVGLLAAQVFHHHQLLADAGRRDPAAGRLFVPHWLALLAVSVAAPAFLVAGQAWLMRRGTLGGAFVETPPMAVSVAWGAVLAGIAVTGWRWHRQWRPARAGLATGAWALVFTTALWFLYAPLAAADAPARTSGGAIVAVIGDAPLRYLRTPAKDAEPSEELLYYLRRVVSPVTPEGLAGSGEGEAPPYVLARAVESRDSIMRAHAYEVAADLPHCPEGHLRLWRGPVQSAAVAAEARP